MNDLPNFSYANHGKVLIDTWWNVNYVAYLVNRVRYTVLIDTWWNVNKEELLEYLTELMF